MQACAGTVFTFVVVCIWCFCLVVCFVVGLLGCLLFLGFGNFWNCLGCCGIYWGVGAFMGDFWAA